MEGEQNNTPQVAAPTNSLAIPFAIVIAGLAIAGAIYFGDGKKSAAQNTLPQNVTLDPVSNKDHILGNPNAKVIIVEYSDTECPFCKSFHETMKRVISEYGPKGEVAWVYRHFPLPFHTKSPKEAEAAECAFKLGGEPKFWEFTNKVFEVTPANNGLEATELPKIAKEIGLDEKAFTACVDSGEMKAKVDAGIASGAKAGVSGTPYSFVLVNKKNVGAINGAQSYESLKAAIDEALK